MFSRVAVGTASLRVGGMFYSVGLRTGAMRALAHSGALGSMYPPDFTWFLLSGLLMFSLCSMISSIKWSSRGGMLGSGVGLIC